MHLFIVDYFISLDTLLPIAYFLKKNKQKVSVCNFNILQDFKKNKIVQYLINKGVKYIDHQPLNLSNLILYYLIKFIINFLPKFILKKITRIWFFISRKINFLSENKLETFLIKNNIKTLTISENFPIEKLERIFLITNKNNIKLFLVPSGLALNEQKYFSKKINFCDKYFMCNDKLKFKSLEEKKKNKNKLIKFSFFRFEDEWLKLLDRLFNLNKKKNNNKKIKIAFFVKKGSHWKENESIENLIDQLKQNQKFEISIRNKPSDIFPNKISIFMSDKLNSSEIIDWCDVIIVGRPSSILVEGIKKDKKVLVLKNNKLINTNFYKYKIFKKIKYENVNQYLTTNFFKKKTDKKNKKKFLQDFVKFNDHFIKRNLKETYL